MHGKEVLKTHQDCGNIHRKAFFALYSERGFGAPLNDAMQI
jgi:hypothetical protein